MVQNMAMSIKILEEEGNLVFVENVVFFGVLRIVVALTALASPFFH